MFSFIFYEVEESIKPPCERFPPSTQRKAASLSLEIKGYTEESEETGLTEFPTMYYTWLILFPVVSFHEFPLFIKPSRKRLSLTMYLGLHFLMKPPVSHKTYIK